MEENVEETGVLVIVIVAALLAGMVAFNTIRLALSNSREEIEVMRLVGASNAFIHLPFMEK